MEFKQTGFDGLIEIYPRIFEDNRGYFSESFKKSVFVENGIVEDFVQDNFSFSKKGVVRGLHFQKPPFAQGKLVKVSVGRVLDVAVDLRPNSKTFGKYFSVILDDKQHNMLYVPPGFAHGFSAFEDTIFSYKCTAEYNKASEVGIIYNDQDLNVNWEVDNPIVSEKDLDLSKFVDHSFDYFR